MGVSLVIIKKSAICDKDFELICQKIAELERSVMPDDPWSATAIQEVLSQFGAGLLINIEGEPNTDLSSAVIKGYCIYQIIFEDSELHRIGTHPNFRRQGIARQLLDELIYQVRQAHCQQLLLEVRDDNTAAIKLYHQVGLEPFGVRKNYYTSGETICDALIMRLVLNNTKD
ncbi:ribosomal protein S18-alanine N-acetyltransferase [Moraxella canis]|nr:ribosomal protein S18-alanine N-acetyltransferase [Moraxella canis]